MHLRAYTQQWVGIAKGKCHMQEVHEESRKAGMGMLTLGMSYRISQLMHCLRSPLLTSA